MNLFILCRFERDLVHDFAEKVTINKSCAAELIDGKSEIRRLAGSYSERNASYDPRSFNLDLKCRATIFRISI